MNVEKLKINREACKRMLMKNMSHDYIKEITILSRKQIRNIDKIHKSFVGYNDHHLRKQYASKHHLINYYYYEDKTRYYTGVDIDRSEFYKNKLIQNGGRRFERAVNAMEINAANMMRLKALLRLAEHTNYSDELWDACTVPYKWDSDNLDYCDAYFGIKDKTLQIEEKRFLLKMFSAEENLKRIAFITNLPDEKVEEFKIRNSIFFINNRLDLRKVEDKIEIWDNELRHEIARRSIFHWTDAERNMELFGIDTDELRKYRDESTSQRCESYEIRRDIAENLMKDSHYLQDISEISGISKFYLNFIVDCKYYNSIFERYYGKYSDEELVDYKV